MPVDGDPLLDFPGNGKGTLTELSGNPVKKEGKQVPVIRLDGALVFSCKAEQFPCKDGEYVLCGLRNFQVLLVLGGKGESGRGLCLQLVYKGLYFGEERGGEPAYLGGILLDPENLRVDTALAHQVERHLQHQVQVSRRVVVP